METLQGKVFFCFSQFRSSDFFEYIDLFLKGAPLRFLFCFRRWWEDTDILLSAVEIETGSVPLGYPCCSFSEGACLYALSLSSLCSFALTARFQGRTSSGSNTFAW